MNTTPTNKSCRHCGGTEHFTKEVSANGGYGPQLLPLGFFSNAKYRIRVCGGCGLTEWFVPPEYLPKVREKFSRES